MSLGSINVRRGIRVMAMPRTICVVLVFVALRFGGHHPTHARGHAVSVAFRRLLFHETVWVPHAQ